MRNLLDLLAAICLMFIMIPVSIWIVNDFNISTARHDKNEINILKGRLVKAEELKEIPHMFSRENKVYRIGLKNGEAYYEFYASLSEYPLPYINRWVTLKYNYIRNFFGNTVYVQSARLGPLPVPIGTPIYGKIIPETK